MAAWLNASPRRFTAARLAIGALLILFTALLLGANHTKDVAFDTIADAMAADEAVMAMLPGDANTFRNLFGLDPDGCEGWLLYTADSNMDVSELLIVKASDAQLQDQVEAGVRTRIADQKESFDNYGTNQTDLLNRALVWRRGEYLFYGVGERAERWDSALIKLIA